MNGLTTSIATAISPRSWDATLATLGGHPLQSSLWGQARQAVDHIRGHHWLAKQGEEVIWMSRVEVRKVPGLGQVAWIPRGPTVGMGTDPDVALVGVKKHIAEQGFNLAVMTPWMPAKAFTGTHANHRTIWIDLTLGKQRLWEDLDKQWRYGVGRAARSGVSVEVTTDPALIDEFFVLCRGIGRAKRFALPGSASLMHHLLRYGMDGPVQSRLFVALHSGQLGAGAFILRCGSTIHYMWGATKRDLSNYRVGEAVQWAVIEWGLEQGCVLYDLEGIDPLGNPGTYKFKKKMGGRELSLTGQIVLPCGLRGWVIAALLRVRQSL